ncbi:MAG: thioredoxin fold domain-containing protein [Methylococcales bacterium]|jgi:thioredoxin-related protein|nr:thioredoxin fold domain-containing protein [Methylococcales bacterium]MBT7409784.1 thioredoxin fold domain-containing protein [Methylococcales bacterium]
MKIILLLSLLLFQSLLLAAQVGTLENGMVNPGYHEKPSWFKSSFLDLNEDVNDGRIQGKRIILYFHQDGCPYCAKLIEDNFSTKSIVDYTRKNFEVIAINMWGDRELIDQDGNEMTEKEFAKKMKIQFTPSLLFLDQQGGKQFRMNGYYAPQRFLSLLKYLVENNNKRLSFNEYANKNNRLKAKGKLHNDNSFLTKPFDFTKKRKKYLLVLFEQKNCLACDELHLDIFKRQLTKKRLSQFDVAVINTWNRHSSVITPKGSKMTSYAWGRKLAIKYTPTLVFFDVKGHEVFRAEGYLKAFHVQSILEYVVSDAYRSEPEFQRYIQAKADRLKAQGIKFEIMR